MRRAASIALATMIVAGPAAARDAFEVGAWSGGSQATAKGRFLRCTVGTAYWNGASLRFSLDRHARTTMTARHPRWRFRPGRRLRIDYALDNEPWWSTAATAGAGGGVRFVLPTERVRRTIRARKLRVRTPRGGFRYEIDDIKVVLVRLYRCYKGELRADTRRFGSEPPGAAAASPRPAKPESTSRIHEARVRALGPGFRRAATQVVRKALDRAGLKQFAIRSPREWGRRERENQILWTDPDARVIGQLRIFPSSSKRSHKVFTKRTIEKVRRRCGKGRFGTGVRSLGERDDLVALRFFLTCEGGKQSFRQTIAIFPVRGGYYAVSHFTKTKGEFFWRVDEAFYSAILRMLPRRR